MDELKHKIIYCKKSKLFFPDWFFDKYHSECFRCEKCNKKKIEEVNIVMQCEDKMETFGENWCEKCFDNCMCGCDFCYNERKRLGLF